MDWITTVGVSWLGALRWLALLSIVFGVLVSLMPCNPGMYWWKVRRAAMTDLTYWFFVPVFMGICRTLLLAGMVLTLGSNPEWLPVKELPIWVQCPLILLIQDFMMYWIHRAFHSRAAWRFHAVHHSPEVLDWISMVRFHPVNLLEFAVVDVSAVVLGFSPTAIVILIPFNLIQSALVHANLDWTFGSFRYAFASPVFHRWHHTTQEEGIDKNFAPTFPFLDVLFGTFYMPAGQLPEHFGNGDAHYPETFWGQLIEPFRKQAS